jgi:hypothetical protein
VCGIKQFCIGGQVHPKKRLFFHQFIQITNELQTRKKIIQRRERLINLNGKKCKTNTERARNLKNPFLGLRMIDQRKLIITFANGRRAGGNPSAKP